MTKIQKISLLIALLFTAFAAALFGGSLKAQEQLNEYLLKEHGNIKYLSNINALGGGNIYSANDSYQFLNLANSDFWDYQVYKNFNIKIKKNDYKDYKKFKVEIYRNEQLLEEFNNTEYTENYRDGISIQYDINNSSATLSFSEIANSVDIHSGETLKMKLYFFDKKDSIPPTLSGQKVFVTDVDNPISIEQIKSHLTALDDIEGTIDNSRIYIIKDEFTKNNKKVGKYEVIVGVKDNSENEGRLMFYVAVKDLKAPVITTTKQEYVIGYKETLDLNMVLNNLSVTDNYDKSGLVIQLVENNYSSNSNSIGIKTLIYEAKDSSNNKGRKVINVKIIDNVKPTAAGKQTYKVSYKDILDINRIIFNLVIKDEIDTTIDKNQYTIIKNTYLNKENKIGNYEIVLQFKDKSNNKLDVSIKIQVFDSEGPNISVDELFIAIDQFNSMTTTDIINHMKKNNLLPQDFSLSNYDIIKDTYSVSNNEVGVYEIVLKNKKNSNEIIKINVDKKEKTDSNNIPQNNDIRIFFEENWELLTIGALSAILISIAIIAIIKKRNKNRKR